MRVKRCVKCEAEKPVSDFYRDASCCDGFKPDCKACVIKYNLGRYQAHKEEWRGRNKAWIEANRERVREIWRKARKAARQRNPQKYRLIEKWRKKARRHRVIAGLLKLQKGLCAVCRCGLVSFEVDHIVPRVLGGTNDRKNLQLLCRPCNNAKGGRHPVEFMQSRGLLL